MATFLGLVQVVATGVLAWFTYQLVIATNGYARETERQRKDQAMAVLQVYQVPRTALDTFSVRLINDRPFLNLRVCGLTVGAAQSVFFEGKKFFGELHQTKPISPQMLVVIGHPLVIQDTKRLQATLDRHSLGKGVGDGWVGHAQYETLAGEQLTSVVVSLTLKDSPDRRFSDGALVRERLSFEGALERYAPEWERGLARTKGAS